MSDLVVRKLGAVVPVQVDEDGMLYCPCHSEPMVETESGVWSCELVAMTTAYLRDALAPLMQSLMDRL